METAIATNEGLIILPGLDILLRRQEWLVMMLGIGDGTHHAMNESHVIRVLF